jgi:hypothetical protein
VPDLTALAGRTGSLDVINPASPAAGSNFALTVGSRNVVGLRIVACKATLTTDANVATRFFSLDYIGGRSLTMIRNAATVTVSASQSATVYQWDTAHTLSEWNTGTPVYAPLVDVLLVPGWSIQLTIDNIQAGDTITAISFVVESYYGD